MSEAKTKKKYRSLNVVSILNQFQQLKNEQFELKNTQELFCFSFSNPCFLDFLHRDTFTFCTRKFLMVQINGHKKRFQKGKKILARQSPPRTLIET